MKKLKEIIKQSSLYGKTFAVSILFLIIAKQILLYNANGWMAIKGDLFLLSVVIILVCINAFIKRKIVKILINILNALILLVFTMDAGIIYYFKSRLSIFEMLQFLNNTNNEFFGMYAVYGILAFGAFLCLSFFITQKVFGKIYRTKRTQIILIIIGAILAPSLRIATKINTENTKMQMDTISYTLTFRQKKDNFLQDTEVGGSKQYKDFFSLQKGDGKKPNIILIYAESFSAIDSKRVGGINNNLPLFDKIQEQGITYTNFLANGCTSETTHIATLQGVEPREHPSMTKENEYSEYSSLNAPLPVFLEENGYDTTFLSTVTLDFLNQRKFLVEMGFNTIYGDEAFRKEKEYTFGAAPDEALYDKASKLIQQQKAPYFLAMQTISSHEPYDSPYGEGEELTLKYADEKLYDFYTNLQKVHFFDNGILIILADHRKIDIASSEEKTKYGKTTPSRVLGTVVGKGIKKGAIYDTPVQDIDFYYSIKKLIGKNNILTRNKYNDAFTNKENRDRTIRYCRYFLNDNGYVIMKGQKEGYSIESGETYIKDYINAYKIFQYNNRQSRTKTAKNYLSGNFTEKLLKETFGD